MFIIDILFDILKSNTEFGPEMRQAILGWIMNNDSLNT